jgi:hypothetical protein
MKLPDFKTKEEEIKFWERHSIGDFWEDLSESNDTFKVGEMRSDHERIDKRSLALHQEIAKRIRKDPDIIRIAKENLHQWIAHSGPKPSWQEWEIILEKSVNEIIEILLSPGEEGRRLRQSSPFCGILEPKERWRIYESFTIGTYYKGGRQHRG